MASIRPFISANQSHTDSAFSPRVILIVYSSSQTPLSFLQRNSCLDDARHLVTEAVFVSNLLPSIFQQNCLLPQLLRSTTFLFDFSSASLPLHSSFLPNRFHFASPSRFGLTHLFSFSFYLLRLS